MGWRLRVRHETSVTYEGDARASYNEVRKIPLSTPDQITLEARVETRPATPTWRYQDYWGSRVVAFDLQQPHERLVVNATSMVETTATPVTPDPVGWEQLRELNGQSRMVEFLQATPRTTVTADLAAAASARVATADPHDAAAEIASWVRDNVDYVPGVTGVQTSAQEAWDHRKGVCQDIAHLTVALLRAVGLPARYVSGYLHPDPDARPGDTVAGQSHAWVEYWAGHWVPYDPTNRIPAGVRHVVVARGRDYADVPPLKGIYHGTPSGTPDVTVEVTRLA